MSTCLKRQSFLDRRDAWLPIGVSTPKVDNISTEAVKWTIENDGLVAASERLLTTPKGPQSGSPNGRHRPIADRRLLVNEARKASIRHENSMETTADSSNSDELGIP